MQPAITLPLGQPVHAYPTQYDPGLLCPIPRLAKREEIGIGHQPPFVGADLWTAYELSWLNARGKPQIAIGSFVIPAESPCIIESKSLKLYLNSFNMERIESIEALALRLQEDLSRACGRTVSVRLQTPDQFAAMKLQEFEGTPLDRLDLDCDIYSPAPWLLRADPGEGTVTETLVSDLLKSNCLITHQPDWASIRITYTGAPIDQAGLLQYLVSFRNHDEFHEQCVERIFMDLWNHCRPLKLEVFARYTRRGGLDINPCRSSHPTRLPTGFRGARQ